MPTKTMVLFSGGADSTYVVYKLLTETDDDVTAVLFQRAPDSTHKIAGEPDATSKVPQLIAELQNIRPFTFTTKVISDSEITDDTNHYYTFFIAYAAPMLNSGELDRIATGRTWEQQNQISFKGSGPGTPSERAGQALFTQLVTQGELWNPLCLNVWHTNFSRADVLTDLPQNLLDLTISCVSPVMVNSNAQPCGTCYKCLWEEKVKEMVAEGKTSVEINMYRFLKGLEYGGGNLSAPMRFWLPLEMGKGELKPGLDTKEKLIAFVQEGTHYTLRWRKNEGVWKLT